MTQTDEAYPSSTSQYPVSKQSESPTQLIQHLQTTTGRIVGGTLRAMGEIVGNHGCGDGDGAAGFGDGDP